MKNASLRIFGKLPSLKSKGWQSGILADFFLFKK
jgi:hypothetical protein